MNIIDAVAQLEALGCNGGQALTLLRHTMSRCVRDYAEERGRVPQELRTVTGRPGADLPSVLPEHARPAATAVTLALVDAVRQSGRGEQCPDVDLPTRYAAEAVLAALAPATPRRIVVEIHTSDDRWVRKHARPATGGRVAVEVDELARTTFGGRDMVSFRLDVAPSDWMPFGLVPVEWVTPAR